MNYIEAKHTDTNTAFPKNHQKTILAFITIAVLFPFLTKPVHIDDPLFIWVAQQISSNPLDFFGFDVNWYGHNISMAEINKNPPLTSYFIAISAALFGWSELALHIVFIAPLLGLMIGTYKLAKIAGADPFAVTLSILCCPVALISATTLMVDIFMLSLWVWAIVFWINGIDKQHQILLLMSGILITLAALSKYIAISLIPLLLFYTLLVEKRFTRNTAMLFVPTILIALFLWFMYLKYGQSFITNIFGFSVKARVEDSKSLSDGFFVGIAFLGGCLLYPLFYIRKLFSKKVIIWLLGLFCIAIGTFLLSGHIGVTNIENDGSLRYEFVLQFTLFFILGIICIYLLFGELKDNSRPLTWLLCLWIVGILLFAFFLNWSINGRSILPVVPAMSIIIWRQLRKNISFAQGTPVVMYLPLLPAFLIAVTVTFADFRFAKSMQDAALYSVKNYATEENTLWFQGAWGFQYYMQLYGAKRVVINESILRRGDILVIPTNNSNIFPVPQDRFQVLEVKEYEPSPWASILSRKSGAGFYTSMWGPLPYVLGNNSHEVYYILKVVKPWKVEVATT